jgi:uncharacterized protein YchJ
MDSITGKLYEMNEKEAKKMGYIPVTRDLTARETMEKQIQLYSPCVCGSGKKFKFCCKR